MDYFYCPPEKISKESVLIDGEEFSHLTHVMRKKEGDEIYVVDGLGHAYNVRLEIINEKKARGVIRESYNNHHEPIVEVTLAVGILKNPSKFDFLVEKTTELGVKKIIPLKTERTIASHAKVDRWQKLALSGMKQSGRSFLPVVHELTTFDELLTETDQFDLKLVAHEKAESESKPFPASRSSVLLLIGPEGGFTDEEIKQCGLAGFSTMYLGERRLRTETAAIVATALVIR